MRGHRGTLVRSLLAAALMATAAGQANDHSAHAGSSVRSSQKITLTLWYWNRSIDDALLAQVGKEFPNISLQAEKIGGDYNSKLRTTLAGQTDLPDIVGLNNDISVYYPDETQFANLLDLGAGAVKTEYLGWKWDAGIAPDGRMLGFPMDTGPTALFYRADLFKKAGLPTDPQKVSALLATWDAYLRTGQTLQAAVPGAHMLDNITNVFMQVMAQSPRQYEDVAGHYIAAQAHVRRAWDLAVQAHRLHLSATAAGFTTDWNAAISTGKVASFVGAVWMKDVLRDAAPTTAGEWRVARAPGGAGNNGGSFLGIPAASPHPKEAFAVIRWLEAPRQQLQAYADIDLFPSAPGIYHTATLDHPEPFYGGPKTTDVFAASAERVKPAYFSPAYDTINAVFQLELLNIDALDKNPHRAWNDAQHEITRELSH